MAALSAAIPPSRPRPGKQVDFRPFRPWLLRCLFRGGTLGRHRLGQNISPILPGAGRILSRRPRARRPLASYRARLGVAAGSLVTRAAFENLHAGRHATAEPSCPPSATRRAARARASAATTSRSPPRNPSRSWPRSRTRPCAPKSRPLRRRPSKQPALPRPRGRLLPPRQGRRVPRIRPAHRRGVPARRGPPGRT